MIHYYFVRIFESLLIAEVLHFVRRNLLVEKLIIWNKKYEQWRMSRWKVIKSPEGGIQTSELDSLLADLSLLLTRWVYRHASLSQIYSLVFSFFHRAFLFDALDNQFQALEHLKHIPLQPFFTLTRLLETKFAPVTKNRTKLRSLCSVTLLPIDRTVLQKSIRRAVTFTVRKPLSQSFFFIC